MEEMLKYLSRVGEKKVTLCHRTESSRLHISFSSCGETVQINSFTFLYSSILFQLDDKMIMFATVV